MSMEHQWNGTDSAVEWNWSTWRQTCPNVTYLPQIPHELAWNWTWASKVRERQPTIWTSFTAQMF